MSSIKCLIVDDEPLARKLLAAHISTSEELVVVAQCTTAIEASAFLRMETVDLLFLDIQMPQLNGLQFLKTLKNPPAVILTTAFREYATEAFDLDVVDYLLKPISLERFLRAINKFHESHFPTKRDLFIKHETASILIKANRKQCRVERADIIYIESLDNYIKIFLKDKVIVTRETISSLGDRLSPPEFIRIHRSYIVNARAIQSISGEGVEINGKLLPFGRAFKKMASTYLRAN